MAGLEPRRHWRARRPSWRAILADLRGAARRRRSSPTAPRIVAAGRRGLRPARPGPALLLLDVPVWTALEARLVGGLAAARPRHAGHRAGGRPAHAGAAARPAARRARSRPGPSTARGRARAPAGLLFSEGTHAPAERERRRGLHVGAGREPRVRGDRAPDPARGRGGRPLRPHGGPAARARRSTAPTCRRRCAGRASRSTSPAAPVQPDPAGRAFLALLACLDEGLSARRFAEYLSLGETPDRHRRQRAAARQRRPPIAGSRPTRSCCRRRWPATPERRRSRRAEERAAAAATAVVGGHPAGAPPLGADPGRRGGHRRARALGAAAGGLARGAGTAPAPRWRSTTRAARASERELGAARGAARVRAADPRRPAGAARTRRPGATGWTAWRRWPPAPCAGPSGCWRCWPSWRRWRRWGRWGCARCGWCWRRRLANLVVAPSEPQRRPGLRRAGGHRARAGVRRGVRARAGRADVPAAGEPGSAAARRGRGLRWAPSCATVVDRIEAERLALRIAVGSAAAQGGAVLLARRRRAGPAARALVLRAGGPARGRGPAAQLRGAGPQRRPRQRRPARLAGARGSRRRHRRGRTRPGAAGPAGRGPTRLPSPGRPATSSPRTSTWPAPSATGPCASIPAAGRTPTGWSSSPTRPARAALAGHALAARSYSPTAMQSFAACPYRFVLHAIHKLAPREEPVAIEKLDPLDRGSLVHEILFELLSELREARPGAHPPGQPAPRCALALERILVATSPASYRDRLAPAIDRVWEDGIAAIRADLLESLRRESERDALDPLEAGAGLRPGRQARPRPLVDGPSRSRSTAASSCAGRSTWSRRPPTGRCARPTTRPASPASGPAR